MNLLVFARPDVAELLSSSQLRSSGRHSWRRRSPHRLRPPSDGRPVTRGLALLRKQPSRRDDADILRRLLPRRRAGGRLHRFLGGWSPGRAGRPPGETTKFRRTWLFTSIPGKRWCWSTRRICTTGRGLPRRCPTTAQQPLRGGHHGGDGTSPLHVHPASPHVVPGPRYAPSPEPLEDAALHARPLR